MIKDGRLFNEDCIPTVLSLIRELLGLTISSLHHIVSTFRSTYDVIIQHYDVVDVRLCRNDYNPYETDEDEGTEEEKAERDKTFLRYFSILYVIVKRNPAALETSEVSDILTAIHSFHSLIIDLSLSDR